MKVSSRFRSEVIWNVLSLGVLAVSGLVINFVIAKFYGAAVLGVFNQVLAVFIIFSQFASGGFYFSTLNFVSNDPGDHKKVSSVINSALAATSLVSLPVAFILFFSAGFIANTLDSPDVAVGIRLTSIGLIPFAINKVLMASLNGLRYMKQYSFFQSLRYLLIMAVLLFLTFKNYEGKYLAASFVAAEIAMTLGLLSFFLFKYKIAKLFNTDLLKKHFVFGFKAMPGGLLSDVNTRVDVLLLGYFMNDAVTGIYSFAAMIAEGMYQLGIVLASNFNPKISELLIKNEQKKIKHIVNRSNLYLIPFNLLAGAVIFFIFPILVDVLLNRQDMQAGTYVFGILMLGIALSAGYTPFQMILNQAGKPGLFTLFLLLTVLTNILLNLLLIPHFGILGSAIATGSTFILTVFFLKVIVKKSLNFSI
ncbi:flippase [soil metagenome]